MVSGEEVGERGAVAQDVGVVGVVGVVGEVGEVGGVGERHRMSTGTRGKTT